MIFEKPIYEDYNDIHSKNDVKRRIEPQDTLEIIHLAFELDIEFIACCTFHDGDQLLMHYGLSFYIKFYC